MPDTADTGIEDSEEAKECETKLDEFITKEGEYYAKLDEWRRVYADFEAAEAALDQAWTDVSDAKDAVTEAERIRDAGNPNQAAIDEANERIDEIDAIDPEENLDRLRAVLTGDESGDVDDAWLQAGYYLGLISERAQLKLEIEGWEDFDPSTLDSAVTTAQTSLQGAQANRTVKHGNFTRLEFQHKDLYGGLQTLRNGAVSAKERYDDYGCPVILDEELDEPEAVGP